MSKVHILKPEVISKIAAGEVIERPASVIKELLENALDAHADTVEITLQDAGKSLITVKDNGLGIEHEDLKTIFLRHATSKITGADDLHAIQSLGFRGEALYSIAAISHTTLHSKTDTQETGWGIHLRGGEVFHIRPCPFNDHGTEITVKELFFNTPARKKFLKSNTTEIHQILNCVIPYTLLQHDVRFTLIHGNKELLNLAPSSNRAKRVAEALNLDENHLLEIQHNFIDRGIAVDLILGDINIKRTRRDMQFIFVNNRPVQNKAISFHMNQIYRLILPPELSACFAVSITVPAENIDVNIHPTKREVKINNEHEICAVLRALCEQALMTYGPSQNAPFTSGGIHGPVNRALAQASAPESVFEPEPSVSSNYSGSGDFAYPRSPWSKPGSPPVQQEFFIPPGSIPALTGHSLQSRLKQARYIGRLINKFLLFESGRAMLVIDQHAAAERITYEQLIRQMDKGEVEVQHLLSPDLIKLSPQELLAWEGAKEDFELLGLSGTQWDAETIAIHSHPVFLKDIEQAVRHLLAGDAIPRGNHDVIARRACRSSAMAGDKLSGEQAEHIREELLICLDPFTCPHGRPTVIELSEGYLDKQFLRT